MVTIGSIELTLPFVNSKKERRAIINHIIDRLKRSNVSIIDNSGEYSKEALIEFTFIRTNQVTTNATINKIEKVLFERLMDDCFELSYETI